MQRGSEEKRAKIQLLISEAEIFLNIGVSDELRHVAE